MGSALDSTAVLIVRARTFMKLPAMDGCVEKIMSYKRQSIRSALCLWYVIFAGSVGVLYSSGVLAGESTIDACINTFWEMYENTMREELGARIDFAECGRERNMPYVVAGVTLTACEGLDDPTTNFYVRGPEPKAYLPDYKIDKECSIHGPISCGEDYIINTTIDIQFEEDGALGEWKKFVKDDICELVTADYAADQEP